MDKIKRPFQIKFKCTKCKGSNGVSMCNSSSIDNTTPGVKECVKGIIPDWKELGTTEEGA